MKLKVLLLFLLVLVCALSGFGQTVIETESWMVINEKAAEISLTIESKLLTTDTPVELNLLDNDNGVRAIASTPTKLIPGKKKYKYSLSLANIMEHHGDDIGWWRLSYRVGETRGIISLSELLRDDFDLRAAAFQRVIPGEAMRVRVRSLNPFTERAVKGVAIKAELVLEIDTDSDEDELKLQAAARTDGDGFAMLEFKVPPDIKLDGEPEIVITGQKNGVVRKIEEDIDDDDLYSSAILTTDKPLYQPGQTFNVRALMLDANNTVIPGCKIEFTIEDEEGTDLFRQEVTTSAFGIASISWPIPENAKLGTYNVEVDADFELEEDRLNFKVSRYDLPNFAVTTKADKTYYLPTDTETNITVTADYIFGKPVTNGKVRVVRESERRWNYREQKYDVEEGEVVEGVTDAAGKFVARFELKEDIAELKSQEWRRYEDLNFAAYYTDLTTNRTEQRRLDIRLTKEPIHIYFIRYADQHPDLPLTGYISTFYADGTPAYCSVEVKDEYDTVARFKTNTLGGGKFEFAIPREHDRGSSYDIRVTARDKKGQAGTYDESFSLEDDDAIRIYTDKAIYKPGEMIDIELRSTQKSGYVYVDLVKSWVPLDSRVVELHDGKARLTIPYKAVFKGDLVIAAYTDKNDGRWSSEMRATRGIIFPEQQNLIINAKFSKDEYRPAEDALVRFTVLDGARKPIESAIGLGIFDKAIEERARTEADFGEGLYSRFFRFMGYQRSFGNITLKDLNDLDLTRPIEPEMQLAAEIMLAGNWYWPSIYHSDNRDQEARTLYGKSVEEQVKPIGAALNAQYEKDQDHPTDQASLERILSKAGIDYSKLIDPWGQPYIAGFSVDRAKDIVTVQTAGPDKKAHTADDFVVWTSGFNYFGKTGSVLDAVIADYHTKTKGFIRDLKTLENQLSNAGIDRSLLKDRWNRDYRITFEVSGRHYVIRVSSVGPNGVHEPNSYGGDDFEVWKNYTDYFAQSEWSIHKALSDEVNVKKKPFPRSESDFVEMLRSHGIELSSVRDGYGNPVYLASALESRYVDKTKIENGKTTITPVTAEMLFFKLRSKGADVGVSNDDTDLATFSAALTEAYRGTGFSKAEVKTLVYSGAKGAITGTVIDPNGAVIPGATVRATDESDETKIFATTSNEEGKYLLANLPSGRYTVRIESPGFKSYSQSNIQVRSQSLVELNMTLELGETAATVDVAADASQAVNMTATSVRTRTDTKFNIRFPYEEQTSTPRLREYFPESLVWQPELLTDKKGKAEFSFKMADNITTWKMFAIASNKKGKVGLVEKEITAFQPFFVDLDPPKFLTEGDEIHLPTQVRNYSDKKQKVDVTMDKADWFAFLGTQNKQQIDVANGGSRNAVFGFKAITPVKGGKQRVTAIGQSDSDAIEKPVTVRPNGEEVVRTESKVFDSSTKLDIAFPSNALANTQRAELKIYPNLFAHVSESVEGMLERPYGCGEQTISSTYPNLMILKFIKTQSPLRDKAEKYLQKGYERLIGYQVADGGFTYWGGKDVSDVALTAYALRFLNDAKQFVEVDADVIKRAESWLIAQQRPDGSWTKTYRWENAESPGRTKLITTYVSRSLALSAKPESSHGSKFTITTNQALAKALAYLKDRNAEIDEPYALALFGLASLDAGNKDTAKQIASKLESMAIPEGSSVYWKLETNTPFYGWGTAGRIETTALVLQLLTRVAKLESRPSGDVASRGLLFLLKNKDRYGVWYSTQTTINVLDAFLATLAGNEASQQQTIQVTINGVALPDVMVTPDRIDPVTIDLRDKLTTASNAIEVRGPANSSLMAQTVATHYIDWRDSQSANTEVGTSRALRLDYKCDKSNVAVMEEVSCSVDAERIGFKGYGMLLAEIGTPPGVDVSRESLEAALQNDWSLSRYDVLPDRIVFYMWSKAGGTKFNFKFRPRYAINAHTPASIVYDYYNPEAHATVTPLRFSVK